jgi:hypothetical protein
LDAEGFSSDILLFKRSALEESKKPVALKIGKPAGRMFAGQIRTVHGFAPSDNVRYSFLPVVPKGAKIADVRTS